MSRFIKIGILLLITSMMPASCEYQELDMGKAACDKTEPYFMQLGDRYDVVAIPWPGSLIGRDSCNIRIKTHGTKTFTIEIKEIVIADCGTEIKIYDGDEYFRRERWHLDCQTKAGRQYITGTNDLGIRLETESSQSYRFRLSITVSQNTGGGGDPGMSSSSLSAGALAGIGVGIAAVVGIFVALLIWCCIRYMRQGDEKRAHSMQSVYSTSTSQSISTTNTKPVEVFIGVDNKKPSKTQNGKGYDNYAYRNSSQSSDENDAPVSYNPKGGKRSTDRQRSSRQRDYGDSRQYDNTKRQHVEFDDEVKRGKNNNTSSNGVMKQTSQKQYSSAKQNSEKQNTPKTSNVDPKKKRNDNTGLKSLQYQDNPVFEHESESSYSKDRSRSPTRTTDSHNRSYSPSQDTSKQSDSMESSENGVGCHFRRNSQRSSTRSRSSSRARSNRRRHNGSLTRSHNSTHRSHSHGGHRHRSSSRSRSRSRSRSPAVKYHDRKSYMDDYYTSRTTSI